MPRIQIHLPLKMQEHTLSIRNNVVLDRKFVLF